MANARGRARGRSPQEHAGQTPMMVQPVRNLLRDHSGVSDGIRTHDIQDHNLAL
jgi:hypothetical protein